MNALTKPAARSLCPSLLILSLLVGGCATPGPSRTSKPLTPSDAAVSVAAPQADLHSRYSAALELMAARQYEAAQQAMEQLANAYPQHSGPLTNLGILLARAGDETTAIKHLTEAVRANPNNAVAHNWLGTLMRAQGRPTEAKTHYQKALKARPNYAEAQFNLALLYDLVLDEPANALAAYKNYQAIAGEPRLVVTAWIRALESALESQVTAPTQLAEVQP